MPVDAAAGVQLPDHEAGVDGTGGLVDDRPPAQSGGVALERGWNSPCRIGGQGDELPRAHAPAFAASACFFAKASRR